MAQHNQEIIKVCLPVSTNIAIEMSPASPTIHKTLTKHKISDSALTHIQSQIDISKEEIQKTNIYVGNLKIIKIRNLNIKVLEHQKYDQQNRERDENEILYKRIVLTQKGK